MVFPLFRSALLLVLIYKFLYSFVLLKSCTGLVPTTQISFPHFYRYSHAPCFLTCIFILDFKMEFPWLLFLPDPGQTLATNCAMVVCYGSCILYVPGLYLIQIQCPVFTLNGLDWSLYFSTSSWRKISTLPKEKCSPPLPLIRKAFGPQGPSLTFSHHWSPWSD